MHTLLTSQLSERIYIHNLNKKLFYIQQTLGDLNQHALIDKDLKQKTVEIDEFQSYVEGNMSIVAS